MNEAMCQAVPVGLTFGAILWLTNPAVACRTLLPDPSLVGMPVDGETGVPTNAVLFYQGVVGRALQPDGKGVPADYSASFELVSETGENIEITVRPPARPTSKVQGLTDVEIVPTQLLQPTTRYTLRAHWRRHDQLTDELTFETGAGPADGAPHPPDLLMTSYRRSTHSCRPWGSVGSCVSAPDDTTWFEYQYVRVSGELSDPSAVKGSFMVSSLVDNVGFDCISVRSRAQNGAFSEPVVLCASDFPIEDLSSIQGDPVLSCTHAGFDWTEHASNGCSLAPASAGRGARASWLVVLVSLVALRRVRRKR